MLQQVSIYAENRKGQMEHITSVLADNDINILGSVTNDSAEFGIVRMVTSDPEKTAEVLEKEGYHIRITPVLAVEVTDEVGNLNKLLKALDESNNNVDYLYLSFNRETGRPIMVFHAEGPYEVESCLVGKGFIMTENLR